MVERAVLLAAGRGTRLGALTAETPKPLLEVGGMPLIVRTIVALREAGVGSFLIVTGYLGDRLEAGLRAWCPSLNLEFRRQPEPDGTAKAVLLARDFCAGERFFVGWGDVLVEAGAYDAILRSFPGAEAVVGVNEVEDPWAGAAVYVDDGWRLTEIVEKPAPGTSATRWNSAGLMVLGPDAWPYIEGVEPSPRGEYELTSAIAAMVEAGADVRAVPVEGAWFDVGTPADLRRARDHFERGQA